MAATTIGAAATRPRRAKGSGKRLLAAKATEPAKNEQQVKTQRPYLVGALPNREGALRMSKALMGYVGQPPAYVILRELGALKARVAELERALAVAEREIALRSEENLETTKKEPALA